LSSSFQGICEKLRIFRGFTVHYSDAQQLVWMTESAIVFVMHQSKKASNFFLLWSITNEMEWKRDAKHAIISRGLIFKPDFMLLG